MADMDCPILSPMRRRTSAIEGLKVGCSPRQTATIAAIAGDGSYYPPIAGFTTSVTPLPASRSREAIAAGSATPAALEEQATND